jgi:type VI secretion system lysozyme-like protein
MPPSNRNTHPGYRHSLLDRLLGLPTEGSRPRPHSRPRNQREERIRQQVEQDARRTHQEPGIVEWITAAVKEDLRCLLSASRPIAFERVSPADPIHRSLWTYGMADLSDRTPIEIETADLLPAAICDAIARFEPRLSDVEVRIEPGQRTDAVIRLRIKAKLFIDPGGNEPIDLDTVMHLGTRKFDVHGGLDGGEAAPALPA